MLINVLFLFFVFILGLISTFFSFPRKKVLAWFHSLSISNHPTHVAVTSVSNGKGKVEPPDNNELSNGCWENKVELRSVFATFDKNNDGYITKKELEESLKNIGIFVAEEDAADMVAKVDVNGDGLIDFDEFHELYGSMMMMKKDGSNDDDEDLGDDLKEAFDVFDGDGDGLITVEELGLVLSSLGFNEGKKLESVKEMISKVDLDGDGMVNFNEFKMMMKSGGMLFPVS